MMTFISQQTSIHRFWSKVVLGDGGCINWVGHLDSKGYGRFWDGKKQTNTHRYSYENLVGKIPEGLVIDHLCRNRACVAPDHLEPVTNRENIVRGLGPIVGGARLGALHRSKTHCPHGHEYNEANTRYWRNQRICKACNLIRSKAFKAKERTNG